MRFNDLVSEIVEIHRQSKWSKMNERKRQERLSKLMKVVNNWPTTEEQLQYLTDQVNTAIQEVEKQL